MELNNTVAVVTGASMGIGAATARALVGAGARIAIAARSADKLQSLADELSAQGTEVMAVPTDMTNKAAVDALIDAARKRFGRIDLLVNNAGVASICPLEKMPIEPFQKMIDLNVYGTLYAIQAVVPIMRAQGGGLILNVSSMVSRQIWSSMGAYAATKYALNCLSETLRVEVAKDNIRVTSMFPGNTTSDFGAHSLMMIDPPTSTPDGSPWTADTPEQVAEQILHAIRTEPHEHYMR